MAHKYMPAEYAAKKQARKDLKKDTSTPSNTAQLRARVEKIEQILGTK